jgi:hypothetical protein
VPAAPQFVRCGQDALLQVVERMIASFPLAGSVLATFSLSGPGRGLPDEVHWVCAPLVLVGQARAQAVNR